MSHNTGSAHIQRGEGYPGMSLLIVFYTSDTFFFLTNWGFVAILSWPSLWAPFFQQHLLTFSSVSHFGNSNSISNHCIIILFAMVSVVSDLQCYCYHSLGHHEPHSFNMANLTDICMFWLLHRLPIPSSLSLSSGLTLPEDRVKLKLS